MVKFSAVLFRADKPNCHNLIYTEDILKKIVKKSKKQNINVYVFNNEADKEILESGSVEELNKYKTNELQKVTLTLEEDNTVRAEFVLNKSSKLYKELTTKTYKAFATGYGDFKKDIIKDNVLGNFITEHDFDGIVLSCLDLETNGYDELKVSE